MENKLDVKAAAAYLDVSPSAIYKWAEGGMFGTKYGNVWRFTKEQLDHPQAPAPKAGPAKEQAHGRQIPRPRHVLVL